MMLSPTLTQPKDRSYIPMSRLDVTAMITTTMVRLYMTTLVRMASKKEGAAEDSSWEVTLARKRVPGVRTLERNRKS